MGTLQKGNTGEGKHCMGNGKKRKRENASRLVIILVC